MELHRLAEQQKRVRYLRSVLPTIVQDLSLRATLERELNEMQGLLVRCWETGSISGAEASLIADSERKIEELFEEARLRTVPQGPAGAPR